MADIIGYDELDVGDDDTVSGAGGKKLIARNLPQSFIGMPPTDIPISSTGLSISIPVLRNIRPDRIVMDRVQAASALVYDLRIGTVSLNASSNPVPGDMFAPDAVGTSIRCVETATPSVGITIVIGNRTAVLITKCAVGIIGPSTKPS